MKRLTFDVCDVDAEAIEKALSMRQGLGTLPDIFEDDENTRGMLLGEVCRGWSEWIDSLGGQPEEQQEQEQP